MPGHLPRHLRGAHVFGRSEGRRAAAHVHVGRETADRAGRPRTHHLRQYDGRQRLGQRLRHHEATVRLARQLTGLEAAIAEIDEAEHRERGAPDPDGLDVLLDTLGFGRTLRQRLHGLESD